MGETRDIWCLHKQPEIRWLQGQKQQLDELAHGPMSAPAPPDIMPSASASTPASSPPPNSAAPYLLLFSLFVSSPSQWSATRHSLLLCCLRFALTQEQPYTTAANESSADGVDSWKEASDEELWRCASPMVRYFGLVQHLQEPLKGNSDAEWDAQLRSRCSLPTHLWALLACQSFPLLLRDSTLWQCNKHSRNILLRCLHP